LLPLGFLDFGIKDLIETAIIAIAIFYMYRWIRGSFAVPAFFGIIIIFAINALVSVLGLTTINFILRRVTDVGILAVIIIFQPEIRKLLYNLGQNTRFDKFFAQKESDSVIDEVVEAVKTMSRHKTGALIVFAKSSTLHDLVDPGTKIDARVTSKLLTTIFQKDTPLHDGAVVIRNDRLVSASAYLPISQNPNISSVFGTRHRAALGISESNNVLVVIVSEETGRISVARSGSLVSGLTIQKLRTEMELHLTDRTVQDENVDFGGQTKLDLK
jgi:diadenylate cyclase